MPNGVRRITLFLQSDSQCRMAIRVRIAEQQRAAADLNGTVEFAFLQQRMAKAVTSEKVIGLRRDCLLVVSNCFVNPTLLKKSIAQRNPSIRIRWSHAHCPFTVRDRFVRLTFF